MAITSVKRLVCLASGRGSNFEAIGTAIQQGKIQGAKLIALISPTKGIPALEKAKRLEIPTFCLKGKTRAELNQDLLTQLISLDPDYVLLAGYMKLIPPEIIRQFPRQIVNIHPSLLPSFKGLNAQEAAWKAGVLISGCTTHIVTEDLDDGPILNQKACTISPSDTLDSFKHRLLHLEHECYVETVQALCHSTWEIKDGRVVWRSHK